MDKTISGVMGVVTALAASAGAAVAAPADMGGAMRVHSYADLLRPIPNASALLAQQEGLPEAHVIPAQIVIGVPGLLRRGHHHHHHHRFWRRRYWHHHHHRYHHRY